MESPIQFSCPHCQQNLKTREDIAGKRNFWTRSIWMGNGTDEIVIISGYYRSWDYTIYLEQNGEWMANEGGGDGCQLDNHPFFERLQALGAGIERPDSLILSGTAKIRELCYNPAVLLVGLARVFAL